MKLWKNYLGRNMELVIKRIVDIFIASISLLLVLPIIILVCILIVNKIGKPIFFVQYRPGKNEKLFKIYKFRTMSDDRDSSGKFLPDNLRLNKIGIFLRKTSIDELPQLLNVLKGDMSIVGPRPLLANFIGRYPEQYRRRHEMKPGMTGLAQINGRHSTKYSTRFNYDIKYIDNFNLVLDLNILMKTITQVFKRVDYIEQQALVMMIDDVGITDAYNNKYSPVKSIPDPT